MNLISVAQAATIADRSTVTIYSWLKSGKLTRYKRGSSTLIDKGELLKMIEPKKA